MALASPYHFTVSSRWLTGPPAPVHKRTEQDIMEDIKVTWKSLMGLKKELETARANSIKLESGVKDICEKLLGMAALDLGD